MAIDWKIVREDATVVSLSRVEARKIVDDLEEPEPFVTALDQAQGTDDETTAYLLIEITGKI